MENRELIYLDNAATSFPKPYAVSEAVKRYMLYCGGNPGRGGYESAIQAGKSVYQCREKLSRFFDSDVEFVPFFTMNTTQGINLCIKGFLHRGDHVLISNIEHNAVYRPIYKLSQRGQIDYDIFAIYSDKDMLSVEEILHDISKKVRKNTRMLICTASSNIVSLHPPLMEIGEWCKKRGIFFLVDGAQGAGHFEISVKKMHIDALCVPGHKGLLGPQGCGAVIFGNEHLLQTLHEGGNGVDSLTGEMPEYLPERYEAGTLPVPAIVGLYEGLEAVKQIGVQNISIHEKILFERARDMLQSVGGVKIYCPDHVGSVLLFSVEGIYSEQVAKYLAERNICVRGGYHCAALAHNALGTEKEGAIRISFGVFNNDVDVEYLCDAIKEIKKR